MVRGGGKACGLREECMYVESGERGRNWPGGRERHWKQEAAVHRHSLNTINESPPSKKKIQILYMTLHTKVEIASEYNHRICNGVPQGQKKVPSSTYMYLVWLHNPS